MPTTTFYNLNKDKREKVISAVRKEFTQKRLLDMSVKNIVENANIARGSFYQYFVSKDDLIKFIIREDFLNEIKTITMLLDKSNGDLFEAAYEYLILGLNLTEDETKYTINITDYLKDYAIEEIKKINADIIKDYVDLKKLDIRSSEEFGATLVILITLISIARLSILNNIVTKEEGIRNYNMQIELLKRGLEKKEK